MEWPIKFKRPVFLFSTGLVFSVACVSGGMLPWQKNVFFCALNARRMVCLAGRELLGFIHEVTSGGHLRFFPNVIDFILYFKILYFILKDQSRGVFHGFSPKFALLRHAFAYRNLHPA